MGVDLVDLADLSDLADRVCAARLSDYECSLSLKRVYRNEL